MNYVMCLTKTRLAARGHVMTDHSTLGLKGQRKGNARHAWTFVSGLRFSKTFFILLFSSKSSGDLIFKGIVRLKMLSFTNHHYFISFIKADFFYTCWKWIVILNVKLQDKKVSVVCNSCTSPSLLKISILKLNSTYSEMSFVVTLHVAFRVWSHWLALAYNLTDFNMFKNLCLQKTCLPVIWTTFMVLLL